MHPEENGAVKNSEDRWRLWTAKYAPRRKRGGRRPFCVAKCFDHDAVVEDRFAKQSSKYGAFALATFVYESHDQRRPPSRSLFSGHA